MPIADRNLIYKRKEPAILRKIPVCVGRSFSILKNGSIKF